MVCSHLPTLYNLQPPKLSQAVHREECTQCFDNQDLPQGIDVCLSCFNGGCVDNDASRRHALNHAQKSGHGFTLNIKRKIKPSAQRTEDAEPPAKMTKLAIVAERDEDKYDTFTVIKCWKCEPERGLEMPEVSDDLKVKPLTGGILSSLSSARQSEVKAWEEEIIPCEHTLMLQQLPTGHIEQSGLATCSSCSLKENLWLCLTCGSLGCGRQQYGGLGGNGHGLQHFEKTLNDGEPHPVSVKLGSITAEGDADVYCYVCNDAKQDPEVKNHLATFGINIREMKKSEKSMTELQLEQNLTYDFSLTSTDGTALVPVFGPGLTGLANLGNSCYMASVLQVLFGLGKFRERYFEDPFTKSHSKDCTVPLPADCVECQMEKVADGLLSGRYSVPANYSGSPKPGAGTTDVSDPLQHASPTPVFQTGVRPSGFKALIGKGHEEFATMRQQDSEEFFGWLLNVLRRDGKKFGERLSDGRDATTIFSYALEQRLQCGQCKKVSYRNDIMDSVSIAVPAKEKKETWDSMQVDNDKKSEEKKTVYEDVELRTCLDALVSPEALEYTCSGCKQNTVGIKQTKFASFPQVLVVHAKKFQLVNWVPTKLAIPLILPENDVLEFTETYLGKGLQPGEEELGDNSSSGAAPSLPEFNQAALEQLQLMGFPLVRCQKALLATGNNDAEAAMEWLFGHMEDPGIDDPIELSAGGQAKGDEPNEEQVAMLADMGFTHAQAKKALHETGNNAERAVEWLFNHPDDMGDEPSGATPSTSTPSGGDQKEIPGTKDVPVRYRLKAFISHKGPSVHSGHYVAHIRDVARENGEGERKADEGWVLFNDEKVVKADEESVKDLKKGAYLYVFERV